MMKKGKPQNDLIQGQRDQHVHHDAAGINHNQSPDDIQGLLSQIDNLQTQSKRLATQVTQLQGYKKRTMELSEDLYEKRREAQFQSQINRERSEAFSRQISRADDHVEELKDKIEAIHIEMARLAGKQIKLEERAKKYGY